MMEKRKSLKERMAERRALMQKENNNLAPTEDDKNNMKVFVEAVDNMCEILDKENKSIKSGNLDIVTELYEQKKEGLSIIEGKSDIVSDFLKHKDFSDVEPKLRRLNELVQENGVLLERMSAAASSIASQIKKVRDRNTLDGVYQKTGKKLPDAHKYTSKLDQKL